VRVGIGHASGQTLATTGAFADTLTYGLYRDANRTNLWTNGAAATSGAGSQSVSISFSGNNLTMAAPVTLTVYMRVPSGQSGKAAGTYSHATAAYVYDNSNGTLLDDISFTPEATIGKNCSISSGTATQYNVSYTAFRSAPLVDTTSGIPVSCTRGTQYTLSLDATSGVIPTVQLAYTLTFANGTGSVTATPSSEATNTHILTLTLPAGQAGTCNAGTCTGTSTRTVTITY